jgi:nitrate/nitrite-specific signal transduction histidine kinase
VCAEALSNVAKHAHASHVRVAVRVDDGAVSAVVADDGIGGADEALGSGLRGLAATTTPTRQADSAAQLAGSPSLALIR